jgi:hypothetical protein
MAYTPNLGVIPCTTVVKPITKVHQRDSRDERKLRTSKSYTAYCPSIWGMSYGNKNAYLVRQMSSFVQIIIYPLPSEDLQSPSHVMHGTYAKGPTIQLAAEKPRMMAFAAKIAVARYLGR